MRRGVIASVILHGAIVGFVVYGLPSLPTETPDVSVIPVEVVPEAEIAEVTTPRPEPEPEPEPEEAEAPPPPPEPEPAPAAPPPPPAQSAEAVPPLEAVEPQAEERAEVEPEPAPEPEPRPTRNIQPRTKPEPPSRFDTGRIAALLDKDDEPEPAPEPQPQQPELDLDRVAENLGRRSIDSQRQLATLKDAMRAQIQRCWNLPAGAKNAENLVVRLRVLLRNDGSLLRPPELVNEDRLNDSDGQYFEVAARAAINAVQRCTPLDLPRNLYDDWRETIQVFDPSQMLDVD